MKKTLLYTVVCLVFASVCLLQSSAAYAKNKVTGTTATVVSYWKKGNTKKLTVRTGKDKEVNGRQSKETATYDVTLRVLDETDKSYTIEWDYENAVARGSNPLVKSLFEMSNGLRVIYKTDEMGVFTELVNWKEVQEHLYKALDRLEREGNNEVAKAVVSQFKAIYSSRESIESTLKDINLYHSPYGVEYTLNEKITSETQLPNILGGGPLPAKIEIQMTALKPEQNYCKIVTKQQVDKEKATKIVHEFIKKTAQQSGQPVPKDIEISALSVNDTSEHEIELADGWVKRAYFKRETQSGPARQTDTYEILLK